MSSGAEPEIQLVGGLANAGKVVRVGDTVRRPWKQSTPAVDHFLSYVRGRGFDGVPEPLGKDTAGRAIYSFVEGDVDEDAAPTWARSEQMLLSVALMQRHLHDASRGYVPDPDDIFDATLAWFGEPRPIVCHNDLCISNVVARQGEAVAVIDFDFLAPSHPLWDVAVALRHWLPVKDPVDIASSDLFGSDLDQIARFAQYCDVYGTTQRSTIVAMLGTFLDQAFDSMRARYEQGLPAYVAIWEAGYPQQNRRSRVWLEQHASALIRVRR